MRRICISTSRYLVIYAAVVFGMALAGHHIGIRNVEEAFELSELAHEFFHYDDYRINCTAPICNGPLASIYCGGPLLFAAYHFDLYRSCPGSRLRYAPDVVLQNFDSLPRPLNRSIFARFCGENFEQVAYLRPAKLNDWRSTPRSFQAIADTKMRRLAFGLHGLWQSLSREFIEDVHANEERYPVLSVPHRFIVPGGRFQVYFYWDSYWILKGLLFSELYDTALGILRNFAVIIKHRGFIPNSGNIELSRRSQPPLFIHMLADYYAAISGEDAPARRRQFLDEFLDAAEQELDWWAANRTVTVVDRRLFQYHAATDCPRPENLLDDYEAGLAASRSAGVDPRFVWSSTASACESGLDFSVRWFSPGIANRTGMQTNLIVPVDLNVLMARNFEIMSNFYSQLGDQRGDPMVSFWSSSRTYYGCIPVRPFFYGNSSNVAKFNQFTKLSVDLRDSIDQIFYNAERGVWFDYDLRTGGLRDNFYSSNIYPLMLRRQTPVDCSKILRYLNDFKLFDFKGGVPASLAVGSKEQWDFPNAWAPVVHLFVTSLYDGCGGESSAGARARAKAVADAFTTTVYSGLFNPLGGYPAQVWEKYDVRYDNGISGFGGEYPVQPGFGWTNGAVLDFIRRFYTPHQGSDEKDYSFWDRLRVFCNKVLFSNGIFTIALNGFQSTGFIVTTTLILTALILIVVLLKIRLCSAPVDNKGGCCSRPRRLVGDESETTCLL